MSSDSVAAACAADRETASAFTLHPRLEADTVFVADWTLSRILLMNDARFPWLLLVPRRAGLREMHDLAQPELTMLMEEITGASAGLMALTGAAKMNIGALGNIVPQLHIHVVARNPDDAAWPNPVWGDGAALAYREEDRKRLLLRLRELRPE